MILIFPQGREESDAGDGDAGGEEDVKKPKGDPAPDPAFVKKSLFCRFASRRAMAATGCARREGRRNSPLDFQHRPQKPEHRCNVALVAYF